MRASLFTNRLVALMPDSLQYLDEHRLPLYASCQRCNHMSQLPVRSLMVSLGRRMTMREMESRLRCARCKARGATLTVVKPVRRCPTCQRPLDGQPQKMPPDGI